MDAVVLMGLWYVGGKAAPEPLTEQFTWCRKLINQSNMIVEYREHVQYCAKRDLTSLL